MELFNFQDWLAERQQLIARIWRITLKNELTTQKANEELISTTQKEDATTQKVDSGTTKPLTTTQKTILSYLKAHPKATRKEVVDREKLAAILKVMGKEWKLSSGT